MSTFIAHGLTGVLLARTMEKRSEEAFPKRVIVLSGVVSALADIDVVIFMAFRPAGMAAHRGFTHSLVFAIAVSLIAAFFGARGSRMRLKDAFAVLFLGAFSHLILDYLMGRGAPIPFFAPFSYAGLQCPFVAVPIAYFSTTSAGWLSMLTFGPAVIGLALELLILLPLFLALTPSRAGRRFWLFGISILAELFTLLCYNVLLT